MRTLKKKPREPKPPPPSSIVPTSAGDPNWKPIESQKSPRRIEDQQKPVFDFGVGGGGPPPGMKKDSSTDTGSHFTRSATYSSRHFSFECLQILKAFYCYFNKQDKNNWKKVASNF